MVKVSEIACILKQMNELDASKKKVFTLPVIKFKTTDKLRQKKRKDHN